MSGRTRLLIFTPSLEPEGLDPRLWERVRNLDRARWEVHLVVARDPPAGARTPGESTLSAPADLALTCLHQPRGLLGHGLALFRMWKVLRRFQPAIVLDHPGGNLGLLLLGWVLRKRIIWVFRGTAEDRLGEDLAAPRVLPLLPRLSRWVDLILFPSQKALLKHLTLGLRATRMQVVGHDLDLLPPAAPPPATSGMGQTGHPRYLLRFDDLCPTMKWSNWDEMEQILLDAGIEPLLAVVPDNRDPKLMQDPPSPAFWDRMRSCQARGWTIALHGYQHTYVNAEPGLLGLNRQSEFAGLTYEAQLEKLRKGLAVFDREGLHADAWVAPSHTFDWATLAALGEVGIRTISDGMGLAPFTDPLGNVWVPQQFANMRPMPFGIWTFCYHLDGFTRSDMAKFRARLAPLRRRMITFNQAVEMGDRPQSPADRLVGIARQGVSSLRRGLG
jgi:hypothetical protein